MLGSCPDILEATKLQRMGRKPCGALGRPGVREGGRVSSDLWRMMLGNASVFTASRVR